VFHGAFAFVLGCSLQGVEKILMWDFSLLDVDGASSHIRVEPSPLQFRIMLSCDQNAGCRLAFTIVYDLKPVPVPTIFAVSAPRFVNALQFLMLFSQTRTDLAD
jgi:hypothetical protein